MPTLAHEADIRRDGFKGLYSPDGFSIAWFQYHGMLLNKLNAMTAGMPPHPRARTAHYVLQGMSIREDQC